MTVFGFINLAGGIGLFLYGMTIMGTGLEKLAGSKLESTLKKLTSSTWRGVLLGALLTGAIQSSAATIVITVGLVNSGIMQMEHAIGVIMGANIGTTVTAQLIRLTSIESSNIFLTLIKPTTLAPMFAIIGAILFVFTNSAKKKNIGQLMLGFGILFTGMFAMEAAVMPLRDSPLFIQLFATLKNPLLGVLAGALVTAAIQSSSVSVGILQAVSATGLITWGAAVPIILGQNIGTCVTPLLSSIGASKSARRTAFIHLYFNVIGTGAYLIALLVARAFLQPEILNATIDTGGIANFHLFFNASSTLLLLPFSKLLGKLAEATIKKTADETNEEIIIPVLDERLLNSSSLAIDQASSALQLMGDIARDNYALAAGLFDNYSIEHLSRLSKNEDVLDKLEVSVSNYLVRITEFTASERENRVVTTLINLVTEFERIGDYDINISELAAEMKEKALKFSSYGSGELNILSEALVEIIDLSVRSFKERSLELAEKVEPLEQVVDKICYMLRRRHIKRLQTGECEIQTGVIFLEILTNIERISDHCSNVAAFVIGVFTEADTFDAHELRERLHAGKDEQYNALSKAYIEKYVTRLEEVPSTNPAL